MTESVPSVPTLEGTDGQDGPVPRVRPGRVLVAADRPRRPRRKPAGAARPARPVLPRQVPPRQRRVGSDEDVARARRRGRRARSRPRRLLGRRRRRRPRRDPGTTPPVRRRPRGYRRAIRLRHPGRAARQRPLRRRRRKSRCARLPPRRARRVQPALDVARPRPRPRHRRRAVLPPRQPAQETPGGRLAARQRCEGQRGSWQVLGWFGTEALEGRRPHRHVNADAARPRRNRQGPPERPQGSSRPSHPAIAWHLRDHLDGHRLYMEGQGRREPRRRRASVRPVLWHGSAATSRSRATRRRGRRSRRTSPARPSSSAALSTAWSTRVTRPSSTARTGRVRCGSSDRSARTRRRSDEPRRPPQPQHLDDTCAQCERSYRWCECGLPQLLHRRGAARRRAGCPRL